MYSINVPYTVEKIESAGSINKYLLTVNNKPYSIGELLFMIIKSIADGQSVEDAAQSLNRWSGDKYTFTADKLRTIIENSVRPLGILDGAKEEVATGYIVDIRGKWTLAKFHHIRWLLALMKYLYQPAVFFPVLAVTAGFNIYYMTEINRYSETVRTVFAAQGACLWSLSNIQYFYPLGFVIMFLHELGHAASAHLFGIKTKKIGFGLYMIFPVMFADVTGVWKLSSMKRVIINLGGIYLQLIINLALIYWIYHSPDLNTTIIIRYLITVNVAMIIINVNPFFKFDGYWVYSDLFNLPNLRQQSQAYMAWLVKRVFPRTRLRVDQNIAGLMNPRNPFLIAFSLLKYVFFGYVSYLVVKISISLTADIKAVIAQLSQGDCTICALELYFKTGVTTAIFTYVGYGIVRQFVDRSSAASKKTPSKYQAH